MDFNCCVTRLVIGVYIIAKAVIDLSIDSLISICVPALTVPMHLGLKRGQKEKGSVSGRRT